MKLGFPDTTAVFGEDELIPIDWMETKTPSSYLINGKRAEFDWG